MYRAVYLRPGEVTAVEGKDSEAAESLAVTGGVRGQTQSVVAKKIHRDVMFSDRRDRPLIRICLTHTHTRTHLPRGICT